jgi:AmiR/NasT family two-component response regulator
VLLGTADDRFMRLARFLLTRNNFEVESTKRVVNTINLVEKHRADVVVIDASDSLGEAARAVAASYGAPDLARADLPMPA